MKRLALTLAILAAFAFGGVAQNVWKTIGMEGELLGVSADGSIFSNCGYSGLHRSQDEGVTWELNYDTYVSSSHFTINDNNRIFIFNQNSHKLCYSDDNGDTWQGQTSGISTNWVEGIFPLSNDTIFMANRNKFFWTFDGGDSWNETPIDFIDDAQFGSILADHEGNVYVSTYSWTIPVEHTGIYTATMDDLTQWTVKTQGGARDMAFDSEGNILAASPGTFLYDNGVYFVNADRFALASDDVIFAMKRVDWDNEALFYSTDHGETYTQCSNLIPSTTTAPDPDLGLFKGHDNHLYCHGDVWEPVFESQHYKSIYDANHILDYDYVPMIHEGNDRQKWNVVYIGSMNYPNDYFTDIQSIRDDITLDGVDYKLVWIKNKNGIAKAGAVREEDRRVYYRRKISQNYQDEVLLYDFNLTVGDTVTVNWMHQQMIVQEETEVEVDGTMRRKLVFHPEEYWIEGVGSSYGFLNSGYEGFVGSFVHLLCYHENGNLIWDNEEFDDCVMNSDGAPATFAPQGAEWYFDVFNPWGTHPEYQRFFVDGDTIIQGHQCNIIDQHFVDTGHEGGEFVYEEDNKVYWFNPTTNAFSTLYDFDAEAGESWDYEVGDCTHQVIVDSVGSATWNGHTYRTQWVRFNEDLQYYSGKIMEGIGYERGLFPSIEVCNGWEVFDASEIEYLRCYVNEGEMLYHEGGYDCDQTAVTPPIHPEWYYEIQNENGSITYQYMYQAGDTIIQDEPTHILVKINTLYDKGLREEVTHEYVFELNGKLYWWNKRLQRFTVLYDYEAEVGDSWNIMVGIEPPLTMHVDAVEDIEYEGRTYRMLHVIDPEDLFSGNIVCGIGHLTSFFPERLMNNGDGVRVEGLRCYWVEDELVFNPDGEDCDAIYEELHGVEENGTLTCSGTAGAFVVYPNPTDGVLVVETVCTPSLPDQTYRITNLMGQTLLTGQITTETQQIDVSALPEGMYFITFAGKTQKFVVR